MKVMCQETAIEVNKILEICLNAIIIEPKIKRKIQTRTQKFFRDSIRSPRALNIYNIDRQFP